MDWIKITTIVVTCAAVAAITGWAMVTVAIKYIKRHDR